MPKLLVLLLLAACGVAHAAGLQADVHAKLQHAMTPAEPHMLQRDRCVAGAQTPTVYLAPDYHAAVQMALAAAIMSVAERDGPIAASPCSEAHQSSFEFHDAVVTPSWLFAVPREAH